MKNQLDLILSIVSIVLSIIGCIVLYAMKPTPGVAPTAPALSAAQTTLTPPDQKGMVVWANGLSNAGGAGGGGGMAGMGSMAGMGGRMGGGPRGLGSMGGPGGSMGRPGGGPGGPGGPGGARMGTQ